MKRRNVICFFIFFLFVACNSEDTTLPQSSSVSPVREEINFTPTSPVSEKTAIYFLVDNSSSMERVCEDNNGRRFSFINFLLRILHTASVSNMNNLMVGAVSFGNDSKNYEPLIPLSIIRPSSHQIASYGKAGDHQDYEDAITQAILELKNEEAQKNYIFIITDGIFSPSDSPDSVQRRVTEETKNNNLFILVGLMCPEKIPSLNLSNINGINGRVTVFPSIEDAGKALLGNLSAFVNNSILISPEEHQNTLTVPGGYIGLHARFWDRVSDSTFLSIQDPSASESWDVSSAQIAHDIRPETGCPQHELIIIPNTNSHWLLFIQFQTFRNLKLTVELSDGLPIEIVNNNPLIFDFQVEENSFPGYDLRNWSDCFKLDFVGSDDNPINGFVTPVPVNGTNYMSPDISFEKLLGQIQWYPPPYNYPDIARIKMIIRQKDNIHPSWEALYNLPVKFQPEFVKTESPLISSEDRIIRNITFNNVSDDPMVYLVTDLSINQLIDLRNNVTNRKFQKLDYFIGDKEASFIAFSTSCALSEEINLENYTCLLSVENNLPLSYTYTFNTFSYIVNDYHFNRLFFVWDESPITKAAFFECDLVSTFVSCSLLNPPPSITNK